MKPQFVVRDRSIFSVPLLALFILFTFTISGCDDNSSNSNGGGTSLLEILQSDEDFEILYGLLENTLLATQLESDGPVTLFAPTDAAFNALPQGFLQGLSNQQKQQLLSYHLYQGAIEFDDSISNQTRKFTTLHGDEIFIRQTIAGAVVNGVFVTNANTKVSNGYIHEVNELLYPDIFGTILENLNKRFDYTALTGKSEFFEVLELLEEEGPITFIVPELAALQNLEQELGMQLTEEDWSELLGYHIVFENLSEYGPGTWKIMPTLAADSLYIRIWHEGTYVINNTIIETELVPSANGTLLFAPGVMLPDKYVDVLTLMQKRLNLSTMRNMFALARLTLTLSDLNEEYTIFAPRDGVPDLNTWPQDVQGLAAILKHHVITEKVMSVDLQDGQTLTNWFGETITVQRIGNVITLNGTATITLADLQARNGVVHVMNGTLTPSAN